MNSELLISEIKTDTIINEPNNWWDFIDELTS